VLFDDWIRENSLLLLNSHFRVTRGGHAEVTFLSDQFLGV
jgi:hypothetical protein